MNETEAILRITIENQEDIELFEFTNAMQALSNQYYSFLNAKSDTKVKQNYKLYVKQLTHGSIIIDLCEKAPHILPALTPVIVEFSSYIVSTLDYLCGTVRDKFYNLNLSKIDLLNLKKLVEPVANVNGNQLSFHITFGDVNINRSYNSTQASACQNKCDKEIKKLENGDNIIEQKLELVLYQARNSKISNTLKGNLGIVQHISDKPKPLSFANDRLKYDITNAEDNPFNFIYIIDLEIKLKDIRYGYNDHRNIKEYEILKLHSLLNKEDSGLFDELESTQNNQNL